MQSLLFRVALQGALTSNTLYRLDKDIPHSHCAILLCINGRRTAFLGLRSESTTISGTDNTRGKRILLCCDAAYSADHCVTFKAVNLMHRQPHTPVYVPRLPRPYMPGLQLPGRSSPAFRRDYTLARSLQVRATLSHLKPHLCWSSLGTPCFVPGVPTAFLPTVRSRRNWPWTKKWLFS